MPTFNFTDNDGIDIGNKYVTKDYVMSVYPDLLPNFKTGTAYGVGYNKVIGNGQGATTTSSPVTLASGTGGSTWKQISAHQSNEDFVIALKTDGTIWTWGYNTQGRLGDGTTSSRLSPVTTAGGGTNWKQISAGKYHGAGVKTDGTLWTWGENSYHGALGDGGSTARSSPGTTAGGGTNWKEVSCGYRITAAVKTDGTLWTWGNGSSSSGDTYGGALGAGAIFLRNSPGTTAGGGTNWKQVSVASLDYNTLNNYCAAIKMDGTLWTWGQNDFGQLGTGNNTRRSSPGTTAGGGTTWKEVLAGTSSCMAIKTDGTLWAWGLNGQGDLGDGTTTNRTSPVTTAGGGTDWKQITCGYRRGLGIKTDGSIWIWGRNISGSLGYANSTGPNLSSPASTWAVGGSTWKYVNAGYQVSYAIRDDNW
jgi:alpha-tubulin suppressor-like RCC1 family protein